MIDSFNPSLFYLIFHNLLFRTCISLADFVQLSLAFSGIFNLVLPFPIGSLYRQRLGQRRSKFAITLILGHFELDILRDIILQFFIHLAVIESRPERVKIEVLVDELDVAAGHLQHWQADDLVVGRREPLPLLVLQVALPDLSVKVDAEGAEVRDLLGHVAIAVVGLLFVGVGHGPAVLDQVVRNPVLKSERVGNRGLLLLVHRVVDLEDLPADQLVVPVHEKANLAWTAVVDEGIVDVGHRRESLLVDHDPHLPIANAVLFEEPLDEEAGVVAGGIVDDDDVVVGVLLVENGLQVELVSEVLGVVVAWDDDAEGKLRLVPAQVIGRLQPPLLSQEKLLDLPEVRCAGKGSLQVGLLHQPIILTDRIAKVVVLAGELFELLGPLLLYALLHLVLDQVDQNMMVGEVPLQPVQPFLVAQLNQRSIVLWLLQFGPHLLLDQLQHFLYLELLRSDGGDDHLIELSKFARIVDELTLKVQVFFLDAHQQRGVLVIGLRYLGGLFLEEEGNCNNQNQSDRIENGAPVL